ncbi:MAG: LysR substrate-binding domain-containing protein [Rhizobiaceae bacterium]|nr:LysR substrate-binding domain-containing protein [Rhizobiaceae bacterium]
MKHLPTINQLKAFVAAARLQSFTDAARDLSLTQAAISTRVRDLEIILGVKLFNRSPSLSLTEVGQIYLPIASDVVKRLEVGTLQAIGTQNKTLRVLVPQAIASLWLIPRLHKIRDRQKETEVAIITFFSGQETISVDDFLSHNGSVAIVNAPIESNFEGLHAEFLAEDYALPICSPTLVKDKAACLADLTLHPLIHNERWPNAWREWLEASGIGKIEAVEELWLSHSGLTVQAALNSFGWAIAHGPLVADDIESGRLVAPFDFIQPVQFAYFAVYRHDTERREASRIFTTWVKEELKNGIDTLHKEYSESLYGPMTS